MPNLRWRHGLSPAAYNVRNVRHKVDPVVDKQKVHLVESVLKSIIDTGFADNCKEELLEFDNDGKLVSRKAGVQERVNRVGDPDASYQISQSGNPSVYQDDISHSAIRYEDRSEIVSVAPSSNIFVPPS